jgi:hypothetical protein
MVASHILKCAADGVIDRHRLYDCTVAALRSCGARCKTPGASAGRQTLDRGCDSEITRATDCPPPACRAR